MDRDRHLRPSLPGADSSAGAMPSAAGAGCEPICSPGFICLAGTCLPQCNPACQPNEVCSRKRTCEPAQPHIPIKGYSDAPGSMGKP